jgi:hypothetical protein
MNLFTLQLQHHNPSLTACKCCLLRNSLKILRQD